MMYKFYLFRTTIIIRCILFLTISLFWGCDEMVYSPKGNNYVDIPKPDPGNISFYLNPSETTALWGHAELNFSLNLDGKKLYKVYFFLDSMEIGSSNTYSRYSFYTTRFENGSYTLTISVVALADGESLASKFDAEFLIYEVQYPIIIDNTPPKQITIQSAGPLEGEFTIKWNEYESDNFQEYRVYKGNSPNNLYMTTISNKKDNKYVDPNFVGSDIPYYYRIDIKAAGQIVQGEVHSFTDEINGISITTINSDSIQFKWPKTKYYKSFGKYTIYEVESIFTTNIITEISNVNDTTFTIKYGFGKEVEFYLNISSKSSTGGGASEKKTFYRGEKLYHWLKLKYLPNLKSFFIQQYNFNIFDENLNLQESYDYKLSDFSQDGTTGIVLDDDNSRFHKIDPATFEILESYNTENFLGYESRIYSDLNFAPLNKIVYFGTTYKSPTNLYDRTIMINFITGDTARIGNGYTSPKLVSPAGNYVLLNVDGNYNMYNISNSTFEELYSTADPENIVFPYNTDDYFYTSISNSELLKKKSSDNSTIDVINIGGTAHSSLSIDPVTGYLGCYSTQDSIYKIIDLNSKTIIKKITVNGPSGEYQLANSYLFNNSNRTSGGSYIKVTY